MKDTEETRISVVSIINAPIEKVWEKWVLPHHILQWNQASEGWLTRKAENDLRREGRFLYRMEAKDGSSGFDFSGVYDEVREHELIRYTLDDGRKVAIQFKEDGESTRLTEVFDAESSHSIEDQKQGWQAILENFKKYVESSKNHITQDFQITIHASPEEVQRTMLNEKSYREWTSAFNPGSHFEGSWEKGSEIRFLGPSEDGQQSGMIARIIDNIPGKIVSIEHFGMLVNGEEVSTSKEIKEWAGARENYYFLEEDGKTSLRVVSDTTREYEESMKRAWPEALARLKELCES